MSIRRGNRKVESITPSCSARINSNACKPVNTNNESHHATHPICLYPMRSCAFRAFSGTFQAVTQCVSSLSAVLRGERELHDRPDAEISAPKPHS